MPHNSSNRHAQFMMIILLLLKEVYIEFLSMNYAIYQKA